MKKRLFWCIFLLLVVVVLIGVSDASFTLRDGFIKNEYSGGDVITGSINISFANEPAQSIFTSNFPGNISLIELLRANLLEEGINYNCSTNNCNEDYNIKQEAKTFKMNSGERKIIGFKVTGKDVIVDSLKFTLTSDALPACYRQLLLVPLGKESYAMQNPQRTSLVCSSRYRGCFNDTSIKENDVIGVTPYCENMTLPPSPAFEVGAKIKNSTNGRADLKMELFNQDRESLGSCLLSNHTQDVEELKCILEYANLKQNSYFLCISTDDVSDSDYMVEAESEDEVCGMAGINSDEFTSDFNVFARPMAFNSVKMGVNESLFESFFPDESLNGLAQTYIEEIYGGDCSDGCYIPFEIQSEMSQNITITSPRIDYSAQEINKINFNISLLDKKQSKITSNLLNLKIDFARFTIPVDSTKRIFRLYLNGSELFSPVDIFIAEGFDFDIFPKVVRIALETEFNIASEMNITYSSWKFGDDLIKTAQGNKIKYTFMKEGNYSVEVSATDKVGKTTKKTFDIKVGNAREAAISLISTYEKNLNDVYTQMDGLPEWIKKEIEKKVNLTNINATFVGLKREFNNTRDGNYSVVVLKLANLDVPNSLFVSKSWENIPLEISASLIDTDYIEAISNVSASDKEALKQNILNWMNRNYISNLTSKVYSLSSKSGTDVLFTKFTVNFRAKTTNKTEAYFIIDYPKNQIVFGANYGAREIGPGTTSGTYLPISDSKILEFLILRDVDPANLKAYLSPSAANFISENGDITPVDNSNPKLKKVAYWYIALIVGLFIVYVTLQEWYKKYYQSSLFKERDDLYNLINFIHNSRISNLSSREINAKLEESGWKEEQIKFAFKKIDAKRTGMFEIPIFRFFERRKVQEEIDKRRRW